VRFPVPGPWLTLPYPLESDLLASRLQLLKNRAFMKVFDHLDDPAVLLSTDHQVVMANLAMQQKLGLEGDECVVGSVPCDLTPCPGGPQVKARTRSIEVQGRAFFLMSLECAHQKAPDTSSCLTG
jgi:hypothetical protein